jgi:hypothetical protein
MNIPADLKYTSSHEWVRAEADGTISIGITEHAQELLGDLVFIELPGLGREFVAGRKRQSSNRSRPPPTSTPRWPVPSSTSIRRWSTHPNWSTRTPTRPGCSE